MEGITLAGPSPSRLANKTAAVPGSGRGIGRAAALCLAAEGADLVLLEKDEAPLAETAEAVAKLGRRVLALKVDCTEEPEVERAFAEARGWSPEIDILVNNVGQSARERASEFC